MKYLLLIGLLATMVFAGQSCTEPKKTERAFEPESVHSFEPLHHQKQYGLGLNKLMIDSSRAAGLQLQAEIMAYDTAFFSSLGKDTKHLHFAYRLLAVHRDSLHISKAVLHTDSSLRLILEPKTMLARGRYNARHRVDIPLDYRDLLLSSGGHQLFFEIAAWPVLAADSGYLAERPATTPFWHIAGHLPFTMPAKYEAVVIVNHIRADKDNATGNDFFLSTFGGKGYPDLFWTVFRDNEQIFKSRVQKNCTAYQYDKKSSVITCFADESLLFNVYDFDRFSRNDLLVTTRLPVSTLINNPANITISDKGITADIEVSVRKVNE